MVCAWPTDWPETKETDRASACLEWPTRGGGVREGDLPAVWPKGPLHLLQ